LAKNLNLLLFFSNFDLAKGEGGFSPPGCALGRRRFNALGGARIWFWVQESNHFCPNFAFAQI